jgi:putative peptidoglycan lipid II flippase
MAVTYTPAASPSGRQSGLAKAAGIVIAGTLLSRVVGMLRDVVVAHQFGQTWRTDAYVGAFSLPDTLMYLIAGGALASTFVPVFTEYVQQDDHRGAWKTFSIISTVTAVVATACVILGEIFAKGLTSFLTGYTGARLDLTIHLTRIVLPAQIFFLLGGLFMGTLNARKQFLIPSLGPTIYNIGIIIGAFLRPELGIYGLMWGALVGAFVGNFALQIYKVVQLGLRFWPSFDLRHPGAVKVWRLMLPILLGVSLPNVDQIISRNFASHLSYGDPSALTTATRVMLIPIGIFAQAMGIAILPTMSQQAGVLRQFRATAARGLRFILFLTVPSSVLLFILAYPVTALLYQHGRFTAGNTATVVSALRFYSLGIFAWSAQAILTRGFYALQDSRTPVVSGTIMTGLFIFMSWYVVHFHAHDWGIAGLAMATTVAATLHTIIMYVFLRRRTRGLQGFRTLAMLIKLTVATVMLGIAAIAALRIVREHLHHAGLVQDIILISIPSIIAGAVFLTAAAGLKMEETRLVGGLFRRVLGRKPA